jgi:membrane protein implicated in regulation of membrane protease activity
MFSNLAGLEIFFLFCAAVGGFFVLLRLVMQFMGADTDADAGVDAPVDVDAHHVDSDIGFKFLSLHGLTAFFMMFGLTGFALFRQSNAGHLVSILGAMAAGFASVWVIGRLFAMIGRLQSSGTVPLRSAVGCEGSVYLTIPANGTGKVMITINNRLREFDATTRDQHGINTGVAVRVVEVRGGKLVVEKSV